MHTLQAAKAAMQVLTSHARLKYNTRSGKATLPQGAPRCAVEVLGLSDVLYTDVWPHANSRTPCPRTLWPL
jgi:hypothetical protein